jgi:hypothetical protein
VVLVFSWYLRIFWTQPKQADDVSILARLSSRGGGATRRVHALDKGDELCLADAGI